MSASNQIENDIAKQDSVCKRYRADDVIGGKSLTAVAVTGSRRFETGSGLSQADGSVSCCPTAMALLVRVRTSLIFSCFLYPTRWKYFGRFVPWWLV